MADSDAEVGETLEVGRHPISFGRPLGIHALAAPQYPTKGMLRGQVAAVRGDSDSDDDVVTGADRPTDPDDGVLVVDAAASTMDTHDDNCTLCGGVGAWAGGRRRRLVAAAHGLVPARPEGTLLMCDTCPRVFHGECLAFPPGAHGAWSCPVCEGSFACCAASPLDRGRPPCVAHDPACFCRSCDRLFHIACVHDAHEDAKPTLKTLKSWRCPRCVAYRTAGVVEAILDVRTAPLVPFHVYQRKPCACVPTFYGLG